MSHDWSNGLAIYTTKTNKQNCPASHVFVMPTTSAHVSVL